MPEADANDWWDVKSILLERARGMEERRQFIEETPDYVFEFALACTIQELSLATHDKIVNNFAVNMFKSDLIEVRGDAQDIDLLSLVGPAANRYIELEIQDMIDEIDIVLGMVQDAIHTPLTFSSIDESFRELSDAEHREEVIDAQAQISQETDEYERDTKCLEEYFAALSKAKEKVRETVDSLRPQLLSHIANLPLLNNLDEEIDKLENEEDELL